MASARNQSPEAGFQTQGGEGGLSSQEQVKNHNRTSQRAINRTANPKLSSKERRLFYSIIQKYKWLDIDFYLFYTQLALS